MSYSNHGLFKSCHLASLIDRGSLDVVEIDAASHNGVDDARDLRERAIFAPARDRYKIFILDEAHMVTPQGFNALLKIVEEPPEHVKFIFATTAVKKIPVTILSRCQRFDLKRVESKDLTQHLKKISELEKVKIDEGAIALLVRAGDGSVRDSLSLLDQAIINTDTSVSAETVANMLGLADRGKIYELLGHIATDKASESIDLFRNLQKSNPEMPFYEVSANEIKIPAGWLIEQCEFKGKRFGDAGVHKNQALVLVNYGNASGTEIYQLSEKIQEMVYNKFKISLEIEVNIIN